jgi:predicted MFS family arabinose efflux permease
VLQQNQTVAIRVMAAACGIMVGNIYICQPLLDEMARSFGVAEHMAGFVTVAAQIGYAAGILFVVPLADVAEPRRLVRWLIAMTTLGLLIAAVAPAIAVLIAASAGIAAATVVAQILIPLATSVMAPERRGRVIAALQTGLILGILLSRMVSGLLTAWSGTWRVPYVVAAALTGGLLLILPRFIPARRAAVASRSYAALLRSMPPLWAHPALRLSAALGFCVFGAFSAFWANLAFHLASPAFGLGAAAAGLFGLWGAPGALLAPLGGRLADRLGANLVNIGSLVAVGLAFVLAGSVGAVSILGLVVTANLVDFGTQSGQIANQARIFALGQDIRARLNTVYMVAVFGGGAFGSFAGTMAWSVGGWRAVCGLGLGLIGAAALALLASVWADRAK